MAGSAIAEVTDMYISESMVKPVGIIELDSDLTVTVRKDIIRRKIVLGHQFPYNDTTAVLHFTPVLFHAEN